MCTVAEELEQRGIKLGLEQGFERGRAEILELVRRMALNGDGDLVANLSEDEALYRQMCEKYLS